jgi:predicted transcriptional regulator
MSDVCLDFKDLLVDIKLQYIHKKEEISERLWYAANAAYTKLTKYYTKINSENFAVGSSLQIGCI